MILALCFMVAVTSLAAVIGGRDGRTARSTTEPNCPVGCQCYGATTICSENRPICPEGCSCGRDKIVCERNNSITVLNFLADYSDVKTIMIRNQPGLSAIRRSDLEIHKRLSKFVLTDSNLTKISRAAFHKNDKLFQVDLRNNNLHKVSWPSFISVKRIPGTVDLRGNPLSCHCSNAWLRFYEHSEGKTIWVPSAGSPSVKEVVSDDEFYEAFHPARVVGLPRNVEYDFRKIEHCAFDTTCDLPDPTISALGKVNSNQDVITAVAGEKAVVRCETIGKVAKLRIKLVTPTDEGHWEMEEGGHGKPVRIHHIINKATVDHSGWIACLATSEQTVQLVTKPLMVYGKPDLTFNVVVKEPQPGMRNTSEHLVLPFITWGIPLPIVTVKATSNASVDATVRTDNPLPMQFSELHGNIEFKTKEGWAHLCLGEYTLIACNRYGCRNKTLYIQGLPEPECSVRTAKDGAVIAKPPTGVIAVAGPADGVRPEIVVGLTVALTTLALIAICVLGFYGRKRRKVSPDAEEALMLLQRSDLTVEQQTQMYYKWLSDFSERSNVTVLAEKDYEVMSLLGEGAFGSVYLVRVSAAQSTQHPDYMALKLIKYNVADRAKEFEEEAGILKQLDHPNIVRFYGLTCSSGQTGMLLEYMEHGDLANYLRQNQPTGNYESYLGLPRLVSICLQIAQGMEYLHSRHFVHRDLACRNCLVGSRLVVKVSDFGMSRDLYDVEYYRMDSKTLVPLRWLPPESIHYRKFTLESDVWSFGVVVWEVFSFGKVPWCACTNEEVLRHVTKGQVLEAPADCPSSIYDVMLQCWTMEPQHRPPISTLCKVLKVMKEEERHLVVTSL